MEGHSIGALVVHIGADANELINELKHADAGLTSFAKGVKTAHAVAEAFAGAAAAAGAAVAALVIHSSRSADQMYKMAQSAGVSTAAFSEMAYAANLSGVETEALGTSLSKLNRNISEAAQGNGDAAEAFRALGINVRDAHGSLRNADDIMEAIAERFVGFNDGANKSALAIALFGRAGAQMIPMLNQGALGMRAMRQEARDLGISIDTETGKAAEEFKENLERLEKALGGVANRLMSELLPSLNHITEDMVAAAKGTGQFKEEVAGFAHALEGGVLTLFETLTVVGSDVAFVFKMIGGEIGVIAAQIAAFFEGTGKLGKDRTEAWARIGEIRKEWIADSTQARKDLDAFQAKVMGVRESLNHVGKGTGGAMDEGVGLREWADKLLKKDAPRINLELRKAIEKMTSEANEAFARGMASKASGQQTLGSGLDFIEDHFDNVEQTVASRSKAMGEINAKVAEQMERQRLGIGGDEHNESRNPAHDAELQAMRESFKLQDQLEQEHYQTQLSALNEFSDQELQAVGGRQAAEAQITQAHNARLIGIERDKNSAIRSMQIATWQLGAELLQQFAGKSKAAAIAVIAINKGLAAAQVIQNAQVAKMRAMAELGPVAGPAAVGVIEGMEMVQLGLIAATGLVEAANVGSGGGGGSIASPVGLGGGGMPVQAAPSGANTGHTVIVHLPGTEFTSTKAVRELMETVAEITRDGGRVVVAQ